MAGLLIIIIGFSIFVILSRWPKALDKTYTGFKKKKVKIDVSKINRLI